MNYDLISNNGEGHNMIDIKNIPIFIIRRDRITCLKKHLPWLGGMYKDFFQSPTHLLP